VLGQLEAQRARQHLFEGWQRTARHVIHPAAPSADRVMMMAPSAVEICGLTARLRDGGDEPELAQCLERAIDSGQTDVRFDA